MNFDNEVADFVMDLEAFPIHEIDYKFQMKNDTVAFFKNVWEDPQYGGSCLDPIVNYRKTSTPGLMQRTEIGNSLRQEISLNYEQNMKSRYFIIQNVLVQEMTDHAIFVDIFLLTNQEYKAEDLALLEKIKTNNHYSYAYQHEMSVFNSDKDFVKFEEIRYLLNGISRMFYY